MITQTAEYALRAVVFLAAQPEGRSTAPEIAAGTRVPPGYLAKVLVGLAKAGIVDSWRGIGGGYALARPADSMTIFEVVQAVGPMPRIHTCPLGLAAHAGHLCPLHRRLDDAAAETERAFAAVTVAELLSDPAGGSPFCAGELGLRGQPGDSAGQADSA